MSIPLPHSRLTTRAIAMASVCVVALSAGTTVAQAQTSDTPAGSKSIKEITVTAERRTSTVQKTAASISVRSGGDLTKQGRRTLAEFLEDVPGVSIGPSGGLGQFPGINPYANIVIRGVVPDATGSGTTIPSTAVYTDGIYQGLGGDYDLDRVEVLRGPQGTLYGRSATGGVVSIYTADPKLNKFAATLTATYGNYDLRDVQAAVNLPIGDELALRIAGREYDQLGYLNFRAGSVSKGESRVKLLYKPSAALSVLLGVATEENHSHSGGPNYILTAPGVLEPGSFTTVTPLENHQHEFWANANWDLGWATGTYIPAFRKAAYSPYLTYLAFPGGPVVAINPLETSLDQTLTQEARLTSDPGSKLSWIGGVFYFNSVTKGANLLTYAASGALAFDENDRKFTQDTGVFGEATYPLQDTLRLTAGLRYDNTQIEHSETYTNNATDTPPPFGPMYGLPEDLESLTISPQQGKDQFSNITYKVRLEDNLTPTNMVYALASSGFLPGDVEVAQSSTGAPYPLKYAEETLNAFEVGSKNRFLDNSLEINGSAYYYIYGGYQQPVNPDPQRLGGGNIILTVPARMYGLDLETTYRFTPQDRFNLTLGAIKAYFVGNPGVTQFGSTVYFHQANVLTDITGIAPLTLTSAYDHTFEFANGSSIDARADMQLASGHYQGSVGTIGHGTQAQTAAYDANTLALEYLHTQVLGNLSATWTSPSGKYSFGAYVRNVANDIYVTNPGYQGASTIPGGTPSIGRTYGATVHLSY